MIDQSLRTEEARTRRFLYTLALTAFRRTRQ